MNISNTEIATNRICLWRSSIRRVMTYALMIAFLPGEHVQARELGSPEPAGHGTEAHLDASATRGKTPVVLTVTGDLVSAKISKAPLRTVLTRLAEEASIKVFVADTVSDDELTDAFDKLPLDVAIKRLLANRGHALRYAQTKEDGTGSPDSQPRIAELYVVPAASGEAKPYSMEQVGHNAGQRADQTGVDIVSAEAALLAKALESEQAADRLAALKKYLNQAESPNYQALTKALKDPDRKVREAALGGMEDSNTLPADATAEVALTDAVPALRKRALQILVERKGGAVKTTLAQALADPDPSVRAHAQEMAKLAGAIDAFRAKRQAQQAR